MFRTTAEKAMAPHSSTLAWKIPWTEEPGGLQSMGLQRVGHNWETSLSCIGENGNPLQYSCLENPMDRGAWWAAVHGVAKSRTQLSDFTFTHWRKWQPTPVFLPGESQGLGSLGGLPSLGSHRVRHDWSDLATGFLWLNQWGDTQGGRWRTVAPLGRCCSPGRRVSSALGPCW